MFSLLRDETSRVEAGQWADKRHQQKPHCLLRRARLWDRWDGEEGLSGTARARDVVPASSVTIGPSLWEKVNAADWDHNIESSIMTKPVAAAAAVVLWADCAFGASFW